MFNISATIFITSTTSSQIKSIASTFFPFEYYSSNGDNGIPNVGSVSQHSDLSK